MKNELKNKATTIRINGVLQNEIDSVALDVGVSPNLMCVILIKEALATRLAML